MPRYLLEAYVPDSTSALGAAREGAARTAALGEGIRHVRTTFLPDDQLVQHVFEAPSAAALRRAGLAPRSSASASSSPSSTQQAADRSPTTTEVCNDGYADNLSLTIGR